jgi:hypothetical protein
MNTVLSVLATLDTKVKQLSLSNVVTTGSHMNIKDETLMNLSSAISALAENTADQMININ